eukprot:Phypoly_transcript_05083.p1 GENE.Phypoly_transcript_05083~~Phypoly_transcript_05083.p1  ORF type:complete len:628 (-),score=48.63 Phypoly_transcript_05083:151-1800(-)
MATIYNYVFNLSHSTQNVSELQPSDLAELCTVQQGYTDEGGVEAQFADLTSLNQIFNVFTWGMYNWLSPQPNGTNFTEAYWQKNGPGAVHLALVPRGMVVSWQTLANYSGDPKVIYGFSSKELIRISSGSTHLFADVSMHNVVLHNLAANTVYYYSIVGDPTSTIYSFTTAPEPGKNVPLAITILGDMGIVNAQETYQRLIESLNATDLFIHVGDLSYADDYFLRPGFEEYDTYEETWNMWQSWVTPIASSTPYMVVPGNHEVACQLFLGGTVCTPTQQNYLSYRNRFRMPSVESGAGEVQSMWSSFDYGLVHFVLIDTESDFDGAPEGNNTLFPYGPFGGANGIPSQLAWLEKDLQKANHNRKVTPWIIVCGHRPIYTGLNGVNGTDAYVLAVQRNFEPLFAKYNVDMYIAGHMHMYERLYPISNYNPQFYTDNIYLNPTAPTYIVNGAAGNDERHRSGAKGYNSSLTAASDNTNYGFGKLMVHNATHLQHQFIRAENNTIGDEFWIVQSSRGLPSSVPLVFHANEFFSLGLICGIGTIIGFLLLLCR